MQFFFASVESVISNETNNNYFGENLPVSITNSKWRAIVEGKQIKVRSIIRIKSQLFE